MKSKWTFMIFFLEYCSDCNDLSMCIFF